MNVLLTEPEFYSIKDLEKYLPRCKPEFLETNSNSHFSDILKKKQYEVIFIKLGLSMDRKNIDLQKELKIIVTPTTGLDHIDIHYAKKKQIKIISLKGEKSFLKTITSTAEHAWLLTLALQRKLFDSTETVRQGFWKRDSLNICQLKDKTLGIIGYGRLGEFIYKYGQAFQMKVIANDIVKKKNLKNLKFVNLKQIMILSDIIIIVANYNVGMKPIIGQEQIKFLKKKPIIVNVSRGKIVDEKIILNALNNKLIEGYACDVLSNDSNWDEKKIINNKIINKFKKDNRLIITPHIGGYSIDAIKSTRKFVLKKAAKYIFN